MSHPKEGIIAINIDGLRLIFDETCEHAATHEAFAGYAAELAMRLRHRMSGTHGADPDTEIAKLRALLIAANEQNGMLKIALGNADAAMNARDNLAEATENYWRYRRYVDERIGK